MLEITGLNSGKVYAHDSKTAKTYCVSIPDYDLISVKSREEKDDKSTDWKDDQFTPEQWIEFFSKYVTARNSQLKGKVFCFIEAIGGSEETVDARKSLAGQFIGLRGLN